MQHASLSVFAGVRSGRLDGGWRRLYSILRQPCTDKGVGVTTCGANTYCCYGLGGCNCKYATVQQCGWKASHADGNHSNQTQVFTLAGGSIQTTVFSSTATTTASKSSTTSTSSGSSGTSSPSSTSTGNSSNTVAIGVGVGVGVGVALLLAAGLGLWLWRRGRSKKQDRGPAEYGNADTKYASVPQQDHQQVHSQHQTGSPHHASELDTASAPVQIDTGREVKPPRVPPAELAS